MSWRTVIISSRCKLDLKMGYLVVRGEDVIWNLSAAMSAIKCVCS